MPSWALPSMTAIKERVRKRTTKLKARIKLKQNKTMSIWKKK
jgi:hypothetical protein